MWRGLIATTPTWMTLPVRLALGIIFIAHGAGKVFGAWGGPGLTKFLANEAPLSFMRPSWLWLGAAAFSEFVGGILVLVGLLTRLGALAISCVMLTAMFGVHWGAFFMNNSGIEYTVALLAMSLALIIAGGGRASVDQALMDTRGRRRF
jgi:putative oxidoreductase